MLKPYLLKLDLQLFSADGGGEFGGYDPASAYDGIGQGEPQVQPQGQGEQFQQAPVPQEPQVLDFGGRRLQANEDLMGLHKDFTEQQRYITALTDQINTYKQMTQQFQAQPQAQPEPQQVSSNVAEWNEETWQEFYDKPQDIIGSIVQDAIQQFAAQNLDPILQERQWTNEIQRMYDSFPDFDQYVGDIQQLVDSDPRYAGEGGLEDAYYRAKATKGSMNPAQLAQDPQFLNQYVMNNPQVQTQMLNQYYNQKQQTNAQLPTNMGRGAGGFTPQTPESSPTNLREASRQFMKTLGLR
jgi:hypothetical protein